MAGNRTFSPRRFRDLVHYIVRKHGEEGVDEIKLRWLLFHADMRAYLHLGRSITGATYLKGGDGAPIPARRSRKTTPDRRLRENR